MAAQAMIDCELVAGALRLGGVSNATKLELEAADLDSTVFTSGGWRSFVGGLRKATIESSGFMDSSPLETGALAPDAELWSQLGGAQVPVTMSATAAEGSTAYIIPARRGKIDLFGKMGDLAHYGSTMWGDGTVARGVLLHPATVTRNSSGGGTIFTLGTVPAGKSLLIALHLLSVTTGTVQLTVNSDDNPGFTSPAAPAGTAAVSVPTSVLTIIPGPITDDRYRVTWNPTGGAVARFIAAVGIT